jgi:ADP-ribose pyrophosphatase YjhB (NUDIX family)
MRVGNTVASQIYPHPALSADTVLFTIRDERLQVLLVRQGQDPCAGAWALPGGFVEPDAHLEDCALRELREKTGVTGVYLEQLYTFGDPARDPRGRVISVAYYGLTPVSSIGPRSGVDSTRAAWFGVDELPVLAFDHREIIAKARERLRAKLDYSTIAFQFMPRKFTLPELQIVYETLLGENLDKRNFRKRIMALSLVKPTGDQRRDGRHRPAALYRASHPKRVDYIK